MTNKTRKTLVALACVIIGVYIPCHAAIEGDTVLVDPGIYIENINIIEHGIVLGSLFLTTGDTSYISTTVIDGDSLESVITIGTTHFYDTTSIVTGFTIRNGNPHYGGGGINCYGNTIISHNIIRDNTTTRGGGIFVGGSPVIEYNLIRDNYVTVAGGGIVSYGGACVIRNNVITENSSVHYGGAIHIENSDMVMISNNIITNNTANRGGAICFHAEGAGGSMINNLISGNTATISSAIDFESQNIYYYLIDNTIADNSYNIDGLNLYPGCNSTLTNNIIWNNAENEIIIWPDANTNVTYNDIQGYNDSETNIDADPLFCDPEITDYSLAENSPCVGAGIGGTDIGAFGIGCDATNVDDEPSGLPTVCKLGQNYPNPFNAVTSIQYELNQSSYVKLEVYSLLGEKIATLYNGLKIAGIHSITYDDSNLTSGVYFYRLQTGQFCDTKKMLLIK